MPSIVVNSGNIGTFSFKATLNIYQRYMLFDISASTYQGGGGGSTLGVSFSLIDQDGVILSAIDFTAPQIPNPSTTTTYSLDLSNVNFAFLFQKYQIIGAIKDANGSIYQTTPIYKKVCQPIGVTDGGFVPGLFQLISDCSNNTLTINELTLLVYNNQTPYVVTKTGTLSYPVGTVDPITFTSTPFSNNVIYTGSYRINCTTVGEYNLGDDIYVDVTYLTASPFDVTCTDRMGDLMCCIESVQSEYLRNCDNAKGANAKQLLQDISIPLFMGINKEINGQDASTEAELIKKILNCDCGVKSIHQNEMNPTNPSVYSIVVTGINGTTVTPSQSGSTKTFTVSSNIYQVVKGDPSDTSFSITLDNSVSGVTKYKLSFNYTQLSTTILNTIAGNPTLVTFLNSLITGSGGGSIQGLDGKCIIDLTQSDYTITQLVNSSTLISNIVINGATYTAPGGLLATNVSGIASWLNSLTLGTFSVSINSLVLLVQTNSNPNTVSTISFTGPDLTVQFSSTNATLVQVLQAIIDKFCGITALQVALGANLTLCQFDYNGNVFTTTYTGTGLNPVSQGVYNSGIATAICNIVNRINTLTGITCSKIQAIFASNPTAAFNNTTDWYMASVGGNCTQLTGRQAALGIIAAINTYSDVKSAYCAIDCTIPGTCPDITSINSGIVSGTNIGIYGVGFTTTPAASQTVTVRYKLHSNPSYIISTSSLLISPSGNVAASPPYVITGLMPGSTYDIFITNNCGGVGFVGQVLVPSSTVYSGPFLVDSVIYAICGDSPVTLYSSAPFGTGVTMYTDLGLTILASGHLFIASGGQIYNINSGTAVVGGNTGNNCSAGTAGAFRLDTSSGTICSAPGITLYTNGGFAIGQTMYIDSSLSTPVTGYTFIENISDGVIYNLNSSTGVVISSTGSNCGGSNLVVAFNNTSSGTGNILAITGIPGFALPGSLTPGNDYFGTHSSAFTGAINVQVSNGSAATLCLYKNNVFTHSVNTFGSGTYSFPSDSYLSSDSITIIWSLTGC